MTSSGFETRYSMLTDVGCVRAHNEDAFLADPALGLFAVADGMGGHQGGKTASHLAVGLLGEGLPGPPEAPEEARREALATGVRRACRTIFDTALGDLALRGMGTTLTCLWVAGAEGVVAHVGDSRCYLLREGRLTQLTDDHTLVNEQPSAAARTQASVDVIESARARLDREEMNEPLHEPREEALVIERRFAVRLLLRAARIVEEHEIEIGAVPELEPAELAVQTNHTTTVLVWSGLEMG